jgi:hypothetical protein
MVVRARNAATAGQGVAGKGIPGAGVAGGFAAQIPHSFRPPHRSRTQLSCRTDSAHVFLPLVAAVRQKRLANIDHARYR